MYQFIVIKAVRIIKLGFALGMILSVVMVFNSCTYEKGEALAPVTPSGQCDTAQYTYTTDIENIILTNCAIPTCHDAATKADGFNFTSYSDNALQNLFSNIANSFY